MAKVINKLLDFLKKSNSIACEGDNVTVKFFLFKISSENTSLLTFKLSISLSKLKPLFKPYKFLNSLKYSSPNEKDLFFFLIIFTIPDKSLLKVSNSIGVVCSSVLLYQPPPF